MAKKRKHWQRVSLYNGKSFGSEIRASGRKARFSFLLGFYLSEIFNLDEEKNKASGSQNNEEIEIDHDFERDVE